MQILLSLCLGIGLSAACGLRVFVPPLLIGIAARLGALHLSPGFDWLASTPAILALAAAAIFEIAAYHIPWLDHLLDVAAAPIAVAAGILATAATATELSPLMRWTIAAIAGGGIAGILQALTIGGRHLSLATTGGFGNPLFAALETAASVGLSLIAIVLPLLGALLAVLAIVGVMWLWGRMRREVISD